MTATRTTLAATWARSSGPSLLVLAVTILTSGRAVAEPPPSAEQSSERNGIGVRARVAPVQVSLVDSVTLKISVEGPAPVSVEPFELRPGPGWTLKTVGGADFAAITTVRQAWSRSFILVPDRPGLIPIALPAVRVRAGGQQSALEFQLEPLTAEVTSSLTRVAVDEARELTGPEYLPPVPASSSALWWSGVSLTAGLATVGLWFRFRRRPNLVSELAPREQLAAEVNRLALQAPNAEALSSAVRAYLSRDHGISHDLTIEEAVIALPAHAATVWGNLLARIDLARYARAGFTVEEWRSVLETVRVQATLTVAEAPASTGTAANG